VEEDCRTYKLVHIDGRADARVQIGKLTSSQNEVHCEKETKSKIVVDCKTRKDEEEVHTELDRNISS
jgi:hypothetical protein